MQRSSEPPSLTTLPTRRADPLTHACSAGHLSASGSWTRPACRARGIFVASDRGFNPSARRHVSSLRQTNCPCLGDHRGGFSLRMQAVRTRSTVEPEHPHLRGRQSGPARRRGRAPAHVGFVSQGRRRRSTTTQVSSLLDHVAAPAEVMALRTHWMSSFQRRRGLAREVIQQRWCAQHTYDAAHRSSSRSPFVRSSRWPFASLNRGDAA